MDKLVTGLGPAFAAGFAVQRLLEVFDGVVNLVPGTVAAKKTVTAVLSIGIGLLLALAGLRVLEPLGLDTRGSLVAADVFVTALVLSAGTEFFNSILKFLSYAKEDKKAQAATSLQAAAPPEDAPKVLAQLNPPQRDSAIAPPQ
ncbi:MAG TPA: hypothetical protein VF486_25780 [Actinomycetes bacterium]